MMPLSRRLSQRHNVGWLVITALFGIVASSNGARAETNFRVLFEATSSVPVTTGAEGARNAEAYVQIANVMGRLSSLPHVRFIFVAQRQGVCSDKADCIPEQLMWQRVNAATVEVKRLSTVKSENLPYQRIGWSFVDELPAGTSVSPARQGGAAIELQLQIDSPNRDGPCAWFLLFNDPALPPTIGAVAGSAFIPVGPGRPLPVAGGAVVALKPAIERANAVVPVWRNGGGEFRRADQSIMSGKAGSVPDGATELLLLDSGRKDISDFVLELTDTFRPVPKLPGELQTRITRDFPATRGFDDHVSPAPKNIAAQREEPSRFCRFEFSPFVAFGELSR